MKLIIEKDLVTFHEVNSVSSNDMEEIVAVLERYNDMSDIADKLGVRHVFELRPDGVHLRVNAQKVTLEEVDMNYLFSDVLCWFGYTLRYAALGGEGCDFAMVITSKGNRDGSN